MANRRLSLIKLLDQEMCQHCRFGSMTTAVLEDGTEQYVVKCARLDCDNWIHDGDVKVVVNEK